LGYQAGYTTDVGDRNTAVGSQALYSNTSGQSNVAIGFQPLYNNTTGSNNIAIGSDSSATNGALESNTTGSSNVAVGNNALTSNTTADNNTAVGINALKLNTTGTQNVAVGGDAGDANVSGNYNTLIGYNAGGALDGNFNAFLGRSSGSAVTSGTKNTIIGSYNGNQGGLDIRTSDNNIVLSNGDGDPRLYLNNTAALVLQGTANAANPYITSWDSSLYVYGRTTSSSGVYLAHNATSWASTSDENRKDIIEPITDAVNKVLQLRTVIGKYKIDEEGTRRPFLIAQDVQAVLPEAVQLQEDNAGEFLGMSYTDIIPLLTAAIKEQQATITALTARITALEGA
jgi:trimeric autotransporter adhesin